jgi:hypothetical protein
MKNALLPLPLLLFLVTPALANDHQWCYDRSIWEADLARGRELVQVMGCDAALLAEARRQFGQMDQQILSVYIRSFPAPVVRTAAQPGPPRLGR